MTPQWHYRYRDTAAAEADVREAHLWATREWQQAIESRPVTPREIHSRNIRVYNLDLERKRLAGIAWSLKGGYA